MTADRQPSVPAPPFPTEPGLVLPCYEGPDGLATQLSFTNTELSRSVVLLGSTGSGKSTALRSICRGLIEQNAHDREMKPAMIVFDFKGDRQTIDVLTHWAERAGRAADVRVLSLNSERSYDFLAGFGGLSDVQEYSERLLFGCGPTNSRDVFWDEYRSGLLASALTFSHLLRLPHDFPSWSSHAASWLMADSMPAPVAKSLVEFGRIVDTMPPATPDRALAQFALANMRDWESGLDQRTRSNVRATISNTLRPLLDPKVQHVCRASGAGTVDIARAVAQGQIVLVSIPAFLNPSLARMIGKSIKADFYKAVFSRGDGPGTRHRLAMLIADEYQLSATVGGALSDDAVALPLIRGFGAGIVAATQTLANLDNTIGVGARNVLLPNFNTALFFRTGEEATANWASGLLGTKGEEITTREKQRDHDIIANPWRERVFVRKLQRPICTLAGLSRLEPGQAFVHRQFEPSPSGPVWLAEA
jgi:hypothetical protein